ncbi:MAG: hypothetical protein Q8O88_00550 [bacterium]|nr:hypothetical protein [bacterium]
MPKINFVKKFALIFLSTLLFLNSMALPLTALAAEDAPSTWYNQNFLEWVDKVYDEENPSEIFGERYTAAQVQWIIWSLFSSPLYLFDKDNKDGIVCLLKNVNNSSDLSECTISVGKMILNLSKILKPPSETGSINVFNNPMSGIGYISGVVNKFSLTKIANAQSGFGYGALTPVQTYWQGMRNISYALIVLIVIIFSFMIMFRVKLSPQLVISVQSALPKVFLALVLATFSYAIAGFLIDFMYVVGGLLASLVKTAGFTNLSFKATYNSIIPPLGDESGIEILAKMFGYFIVFVIGLLLSLAAVASKLTAILPTAILSIISVILFVWCLVLVFWYGIIKIPWMLIKNLISIYLSIVIAPLQIISGVFAPQTGFATWFKKLTAELLVYPITGLAFFLAIRIALQSWTFSVYSLLINNALVTLLLDFVSLITGEQFTVSIMWTPSIIGVGDTLAGFILLMISFMIIIGIPKIPDILKMAIMGTKFEYGTAIGEAMAPVMGLKKGLVDPITGSYSQAVGRNRVIAAQKWVRGKSQYQNLPSWLKSIINAAPGKE